MSWEVSISRRAELDLTLQYRWFLAHAGQDVAERYLHAVDETIRQLGTFPELGVRRHFQSPELDGMRSIQVKQPFGKHLIFYRAVGQISLERIMHGSRDLPSRLMEEPE